MAYGGLGNLLYNGVTTDFRAQVLAASLICVAIAVLLDVLLLLVQKVLTPWTRGVRRHRMNLFADTWAYLTDRSHWTGDGGLLDLLARAAAAHLHRAG